MKHNTHIIILLIIYLSTRFINAQTNEIGIFLGGSLFHGDVGYNNGEYAILETQPVIGIQLKRNLNYYFGLQLSINRGEVYANDATSNDIFALNRNLHFKSLITEFGLLIEMNFQPYLSRDNDYNTSPFIYSGITRFYFNPQMKSSDGNWYNLRPLNTEGQTSDLYPSRSLYKLNGISIPIGIGYKMNIYEFITLSFHIGWRITFTDYIDDVSTTYVEESMLSDLALDLANQSNHDFNPGFQRGNEFDKDKYGFVGLSILYSIKDPDKGCNNIVY